MLELVTIAFNHPLAIAEQIRLVRKHVRDEHHYTIVDASTRRSASDAIEQLARDSGVGYRTGPHEHVEALEFAWREVLKPTGASHFGFLDHDVFPIKQTRPVKLVGKRGFWGIGQAVDEHPYLWPGLLFLSAGWLAGDDPLFGGYAPKVGDTGSAMARLLEQRGVTAERMPKVAHGYIGLLPEVDGPVQQWACERIGDWLHAFALSGWLANDRAVEREAAFFARLEQA